MKQTSSVRKLFAVLLALLTPAALFGQTHVLFTLSDFNASPTTNRSVTVQKLQPFPGNLVTYSSGASGTFYVSNATVGDYDCVILKKGTASEIAFQVTVTATNLGVIGANTNTSVRGIQSYPTSGKSAWTILSSDARYSTNASSGGAATNVYLAPGSARIAVTTNSAGNWSIDVPTGVTNDSYTSATTYADAQRVAATNATGTIKAGQFNLGANGITSWDGVTNYFTQSGGEVTSAQLASATNVNYAALRVFDQPPEAWLKRGTNLTRYTTLTNAAANSLPGDEILLSGQHDLYAQLVLTNVTVTGERAVIANWITNEFAAIVPDQSTLRSITFSNAYPLTNYNQVAVGSIGPSGQRNYTNGVIRDCTFYTGLAYGIYSRSTNSAAVNTLDVYDSRFYSPYAGAASDGYDRLRMFNCVFESYGSNQSYALVGFGVPVAYGFTSEGYSTNELHGCTFRSYGATNNGACMGVYIIENTHTLIEGCDFETHTTYAAANSDGVHVSGAGASLTVVTLIGNSFKQSGGTEGSGINIPGAATVNAFDNYFSTTNVYARNTAGTLNISGGNIATANVSVPSTANWLGSFYGAGNNGNLSTSVDTIQELANAVDDLSISTGSATNVYLAPGSARIAVTTNSAGNWTIDVPTGVTNASYASAQAADTVVSNALAALAIHTNSTGASLTGLGFINANNPIYGVTGDNVTDDTAAIQSALNAVPATGGRVVLKRGDYKITGTLLIPSYCVFEGEGTAKNTSGTRLFHSGSDTPCLQMNFNGITIRGIGIYNTGKTNAIGIRSSTNVTTKSYDYVIDQCNIRGFQNGIYLENTWNGMILNCYVSLADNGIAFSNSANSIHVIGGNYTANTNGAWIHGGNGFRDLTFRTCFQANYENGMFITNHSRGGPNIDGSYFESNAKYDIKAIGSTASYLNGLLIQNSTFETVGGTNLYLDYCRNVVIRNNSQLDAQTNAFAHIGANVSGLRYDANFVNGAAFDASTTFFRESIMPSYTTFSNSRPYHLDIQSIYGGRMTLSTNGVLYADVSASTNGSGSLAAFMSDTVAVTNGTGTVKASNFAIGANVINSWDDVTNYFTQTGSGSQTPYWFSNAVAASSVSNAYNVKIDGNLDVTGTLILNDLTVSNANFFNVGGSGLYLTLSNNVLALTNTPAGGAGTVTSVGVTATGTGLTVSGSPVTSSGTIDILSPSKIVTNGIYFPITVSNTWTFATSGVPSVTISNGQVTATTFSGALSSTSTATTASAGDNDTSPATTAFVTTAVLNGTNNAAQTWDVEWNTIAKIVTATGADILTNNRAPQTYFAGGVTFYGTTEVDAATFWATNRVGIGPIDANGIISTNQLQVATPGVTSGALNVGTNGTTYGTFSGSGAALTSVNAATSTVVDGTDATSFVAIFDSATGSLEVKTDGGLLYAADSGTLNSTVLQEGGLAVYNSGETPGGELGGTWASPTIDDSVAVSSWVLTSPTITTGITPTSNDGAALGTTSFQFSDLYLAEGGVINWDSGDATLTQSGNTVTLSGADLAVEGTVTASTITATGFDIRTNSWTINGVLYMGTNATYTGGAATIGITGVGGAIGSAERFGSLTIKSTGDIVFTNPAAFYTSDGVDTRTFTNGNLTTLTVQLIPGFSTNLIYSWSK